MKQSKKERIEEMKKMKLISSWKGANSGKITGIL